MPLRQITASGSGSAGRSTISGPTSRASAPHRASGHPAAGTAAVLRLQRAAGNAAVTGLLTVQRAGADTCKLDGEELSVQLAPPKAPPPVLPAGTPWTPKARVTPTFTVTRPAATRSDTDPSTTKTDDPTFTGKPAVDAKGKVWRYQLATVSGTGTIQLVYVHWPHYPAPAPTDDSGALSNATSANWKKINSDLKKNRNGVPDFWSAYLRESLHEDYHWNVEWQGKVKKHLARAENRIAKLKVDFATAPTEADAIAALKPQAAAIFKDEMDKARAAYNKLGDAPGDPPYRAQAPALDALRGRVTAHAKASKWK
ncbi:MAG TPA: hypothetical protein VIC62_05805 [Nakamurella sp.]